MKFNNLKFKTKLSLMLAIPIVGLLFFAVETAREKTITVIEINKLHDLTLLSEKIGSLVHELQKERGNSAGFIGSKGESFNNELNEQKKKTDRTLFEMNNSLANLEKAQFDTEFVSLLNKVDNLFEKIENIRGDVNTLNISSNDVIAYYSGTNTQLLTIIEYMSKLSINVEIANRINSYVNFLKGKEVAGIERAVLSSAFAANKFEKGIFAKFCKLVNSQEIYNEAFLASATHKQKELFNEKMSSKEVKEVQRMRNIAYEKYMEGNFEVDAKYWFNTITKKIDNLKEIENEINEDIEIFITQLNDESYKSLIINIFMIIFIIITSFLLSWYISKNLIQIINKVAQFAKKVSEGDLTLAINISQKDEIGTLVSALNKMTKHLRTIMGNINSGAENIAAVSQQMSSTSQQMSQGATEQASSNEEVSASMEQMTANIHQNTDNAQQTEKIAIKSSEGINSSNKSTEISVNAMSEIAEKITIINDISFQTNILALNAAVEAARAGEHGKGFAVVAAEVRKLAERSKVAAYEIDQLSRNGVKVSEEAGKQLSEIMPEIEKTAQLVQEITTSSLEQSSGAEQVNSALQQFNQVTQQNAASAEEMASSSEELASQADQLKEVISYFKVTSNGAVKQGSVQIYKTNDIKSFSQMEIANAPIVEGKINGNYNKSKEFESINMDSKFEYY